MKKRPRKRVEKVTYLGVGYSAKRQKKEKIELKFSLNEIQLPFGNLKPLENPFYIKVRELFTQGKSRETKGNTQSDRENS